MTESKKEIFFENEETSKKKDLPKKRKVALLILLGIILLAGSAELVQNVFNKDRISGTIEIRCDSVSNNIASLQDKSKINKIPRDGVALKKLKYVGVKGESALDILRKVCKGKSIECFFQGENLVGIGWLSNGDCGSESRWVLIINGEIYEGNMKDYKVKEKDHLAWVFSVDGK